jgi:hypothetical protein
MRHVLQWLRLQGGYFKGGEGTSVDAGVGEDLAEVGWSSEVDSAVY